MNSPNSSASSRSSISGSVVTGLIAVFLPLRFFFVFFIDGAVLLDFSIRGLERISRKSWKLDSSIGSIATGLEPLQRMLHVACLFTESNGFYVDVRQRRNSQTGELKRVRRSTPSILNIRNCSSSFEACLSSMSSKHVCKLHTYLGYRS